MVEQAAEDNLVELSEIEKQYLGQTVQMDYVSDTDNSPQSLLAFIGNKNVHGLYEVTSYWIITGICAAMSAEGGCFESSFTTEPTSPGLNIALYSICHKSEPSIDGCDILGLPQVVPSTLLR